MNDIPSPDETMALLLDVDGTIADIADDPGLAFIPEDCLDDLRRLAERLGGALALVSGRALEDLRRLTAPESFRLVASHGMEFDPALAGGADPSSRRGEVRAIAHGLEARTGGVAGLLVERKPFSVALHYRRAPEARSLCEQAMAEVLAPYADWHVLPGKMLLEARPPEAGKGRAIARLMEEEPFAGRRPLFIGDDVTDEDGFAVVARLGGWTVKVGEGETIAAARLESPARVRLWLAAAADGRLR